MSVCDKYDAWLDTIQQDMIIVSNLRTAIYLHGFNSELPTYLFVHGVGGNYLGLVPMAYELREDMNMVFVELPGHGLSDVPADQSIDRLREWSETLLETLADKGVLIDGIIAHSFGCLAAQYLKSDNIFLCNPPFKATNTAAKYASLMYGARYLLRDVYGAYPLAMLRGLWMMHDRSKDVIERSRWITRNTKVSTEQYLYHVSLGRETTERYMDIEYLNKINNLFIISSRYDKVTSTPKELEDVLVSAKFVDVDADHVSVAEIPEVMADLIRREVGTKVVA